ncbi:hypothetical protein RRF57_011728 [Xylaria bambusicola]|uniref:Uncharacterized protein n=1 Tax=Xylaria bambusicola TaxID=326684 RepID=A0AAN7V0Y2_9PEZI
MVAYEFAQLVDECGWSVPKGDRRLRYAKLWVCGNPGCEYMTGRSSLPPRPTPPKEPEPIEKPTGQPFVNDLIV